MQEKRSSRCSSCCCCGCCFFFFAAKIKLKMNIAVLQSSRNFLFTRWGGEEEDSGKCSFMLVILGSFKVKSNTSNDIKTEKTRKDNEVYNLQNRIQSRKRGAREQDGVDPKPWETSYDTLTWDIDKIAYVWNKMKKRCTIWKQKL